MWPLLLESARLFTTACRCLLLISMRNKTHAGVVQYCFCFLSFVLLYKMRYPVLLFISSTCIAPTPHPLPHLTTPHHTQHNPTHPTPPQPNRTQPTQHRGPSSQMERWCWEAQLFFILCELGSGMRNIFPDLLKVSGIFSLLLICVAISRKRFLCT